MVTTDSGLATSGLPPDPPEPPTGLPRLGALGWARWAWRRLTSMRTALLLLLFLAVAAIPGSVFPQRRIDPGLTQAYLADHPTTGPWLDRLGAFDVYASAWFAAIYLLLFISLVGCVIPRSRLHARAMRAQPPKAPRLLHRMPAHATAETDAPPDAVLVAARAALRRRRYRLAREEFPRDDLSAERGYLAETGNLVFHLALLVLLAAMATGSFLGYSGQVIVVEGGTFANSLPAYDAISRGRAVDASDLPPFSIGLDDLRVRFEDAATGTQFGAPRDFEADVTVRSHPDAAPERRTLRVNDPVTVEGSRVFLVGNGYAPVVTVRDGAGQVAYSGPVPFLPQDALYTSNGVIKVADAQPEQIGLVGFLLPTAVPNAEGRPVSIFPDLRNPRLFFTAFVGDLGLDDGTPQSLYVLDDSDMRKLTGANGDPFAAALSPGETAQLPDGAGSVTFEEVRRYAALDIRADPTKGWVLGAAIAALAGLTGSLFVRRRRIWVRARPGSGEDGPARTVVEVAGLTRSEDAGLADEVSRILQELAGTRARSGPAVRE